MMSNEQAMLLRDQVLPKTTPPSTYPNVYDTGDPILTRMRSEGDISNEVYVKYAVSAVGNTYSSCGITWLSGLGYNLPAEAVSKILKERGKNDKYIREAFVVFSDRDYNADYDAKRTSGGSALCKYIKDNNLGDIMEMGPRKNPNTGNMIRVWVWAPNHESLEPKDKWLPVHDRRRIRGSDGDVEYVALTDSRFEDARFAAQEVK